jgi:hypothetical protein
LHPRRLPATAPRGRRGLALLAEHSSSRRPYEGKKAGYRETVEPAAKLCRKTGARAAVARLRLSRAFCGAAVNR